MASEHEWKLKAAEPLLMPEEQKADIDWQLNIKKTYNS